MARQKKHRNSNNKEWSDGVKIAVAVISIATAIGSWIAFVKALRKLVRHPTLGNWASATLAGLNVAES
jgi:cytoskeletal protein RodZ